MKKKFWKPSMKCKKGEFAMVVGSDTGWAGITVEIIGLLHDVYPGCFHRSVENVWVVSHAENTYLCRDRDLMPIRPGGLKETAEDVN